LSISPILAHIINTGLKWQQNILAKSKMVLPLLKFLKNIQHTNTRVLPVNMSGGMRDVFMSGGNPKLRAFITELIRESECPRGRGCNPDKGALSPWMSILP
jgi:hypothetical protein